MRCLSTPTIISNFWEDNLVILRPHSTMHAARHRPYLLPLTQGDEHHVTVPLMKQQFVFHCFQVLQYRFWSKKPNVARPALQHTNITRFTSEHCQFATTWSFSDSPRCSFVCLRINSEERTGNCRNRWQRGKTFSRPRTFHRTRERRTPHENLNGKWYLQIFNGFAVLLSI